MSVLDPVATLDAVEALVRRARADQPSFAAGDDTIAEVRALLDGANVPDTDERGARWRSARAELASFLQEMEEDLRYIAVVRSPGTPMTAATWMTWGGTTATVVGTKVNKDAHFAALRGTVEPRLRRLRLFTLTLSAALRIATIVSVPGGGLAALPVAFHLIRAVRSLTNTQYAS